VKVSTRTDMLVEPSSCPVSKSGKLYSTVFVERICSTILFRRKNVRRKLNAMALEFHGKNVLLVDGKAMDNANLNII
jgi:hypothetical protein